MQFFCVGSAESLAFTGAGFTGADKLGIGEGCGIVLWIPHDTEADGVDDAARRDADAPRRAAFAGLIEPVAAAQQTVRTSRGSCGVGHAS